MQKKGKKICALYVRVSTDRQEAENQLRDLREYAKTREWEIYKEYVDIVSGKEVNELNRPAFKQLFIDAYKRLFDIVLFWDLSRFSRAGTLYTLKKLRELESYGVDWHSFQDEYLSSLGEFKDVVISLLATLAKQERLKISERTKAALRKRREMGVKLGRPRGSKDRKKRVRRWFRRPGGVN